MVPGAYHVEFPNYYRNPWKFTNEEDVDYECLRQIEVILRREPDVAAIIGEPISATPVVPSKRYWQGVQELCKKYGALLIFDEIIEGNIITLRPSLTLTSTELDKVLHVLEECIAEVENK